MNWNDHLSEPCPTCGTVVVWTKAHKRIVLWTFVFGVVASAGMAFYTAEPPLLPPTQGHHG